MRIWILLVCLFVVVAAVGDPITVTTTASSAKLKPGSSATITTKISNTHTPKFPMVLSATCNWTDTYGIAQTAIAPALTLTVSQPAAINGLKIEIPPGLTYVVSSATVNGLPVAPVVVFGVVTIPTTLVINEAEFVTIQYAVKAD